MSNLRYLSIDPLPSVVVLTVGAGVVAALYGLEIWARRQARRRTREIIEACAAQRNART
jgi:hypothetical protein